MNKKIYFFISIALFTMVCFSSASCGGNDDDVSVRQQLVGIWKTSMSSSNWTVIELESNGTLHYGMTINSNGEIFYSKASHPVAKWTFNETDQTISMFTEDGYYAYTYKVSMSEDGKSWAGFDQGDNKTYSFTKLDNSKKVIK